MPTTNFAARQLLPALRSCGLLPTEIAADSKVQEVVYLLERAGSAFGYRYKWELFGPYSVQLADEVQDLDSDVIESASPDSAVVGDDVVARVRGLLEPPADADMMQEDWLRLLTCIDFVERRVPGATENGGTPAFVERNFRPEAIGLARERVRASFVSA
jgi:hypothetical protein